MGKIVSVHSYRGGTGKSNLTANLSTTVALKGLRVGIVDTDIQSPGIHVLFGLEQKQVNRSLNDYLWGYCKIEETAYQITPPEVRQAGGTMFLIPSSLKAGEITRVLRDGYDVGVLNDGFEQLLEKLSLDYLFIDTHPGMNEETLLSIAISDCMVLILRPDKQDFLGTAVTVEIARKLGVPRMLLVLNKVIPSMNVASLSEEVQRSFQADLGAVLLLSEEMLHLGSQGIFCLRYPQHPLSVQVRKLAQTILTE
jgi:septum site-determining protein MinD